MADIAFPPLGLIASLVFEVIIVGQLFARLDLAERLYKDALAIEHSFAIRLARMIDKASRVAANAGINDRFLVHGKEDGVRDWHRLFVVTCVGLLGRNPLSRVLDNASPSGHRPYGKDSTTLDGRSSYLII